MTAAALNLGGRRAAGAAWVALTAPGALVSCATLTLALLVVPRVTPLVVVAPVAQHVAALLLLLHAAVTGVLVLRPGGSLALLFVALLVADAVLCGVLLGAQRHGPASLLTCAVLVISLEVGGGGAAAVCAIAAAVAALAAAGWGSDAAVFVPAAMSFPTTLAVETSFAGAVVVAPVTSLPTTLSVETWMGGVPAFASWEELFVPTLALVLAALCLGLATSAWCVRKARTAVAASIVATARVTP